MSRRFSTPIYFVIGLVSLAPARPAIGEESSGKSSRSASIEEVRDRATLLHQVYASTLDVMHKRYFHDEDADVPARAMEDVFADVKRQTQIDARWIAATMRAMNIDHDPETAFEKHAARQITSGKRDVEQIQNGVYRRAFAVPLSGGCIQCHGRAVGGSTRKQFAALVIQMPVIHVPVDLKTSD